MKNIVYINGKKHRTYRTYLAAVKAAFKLESEGHERVRVNER